MDKYTQLLEEAYALGLKVREGYDFKNPVRRGLIRGRTIFISYKVVTYSEKCSILAEEISHFKYNLGNITDQRIIKNRKEELKARTHANESLVPFNDLVETIIDCGYGCGIAEVADQLNVTENFLVETMETYRRKHGPIKYFGEYVVTFEPFNVNKASNYFNQ